MYADCAIDACHLTKARARISNDVFRCLPSVDGRSVTGRRYRDFVRSMLAAMGVEASELDDGLRNLIRTTAQLQLDLDRMQTQAFGGDERVELRLAINRSANTISRNMRRLGISVRRQEPPKSSLAKVLEGKR